MALLAGDVIADSTKILPDKASPHWDARLELGFARRRGKCCLVEKNHRGPLYVQRAFYPEGPDLAHVYLLHPPGGMVSGDRLDISIHATDGAGVLITTPGAGKIYRARGDRSLQQQRNIIRVGQRSSCEWFPQENILYNAASASLETRVELSTDSLFLGWEITVLGLPANNQQFAQGDASQRLLVLVDGRPRVIENLTVNDGSRELLQHPAALGELPVSGLLVAGPQLHRIDSEGLLSDLRAITGPENCHWGVTVTGGFVVIRYLGGRADQARELFVSAWRLLRPVLAGRAACLPRIWAT